MPVRIRNISMKPVFVTVAKYHDIYLDAGSVTGILPDEVAEDGSVVDFVARRMLKVERVRAYSSARAARPKPAKPAKRTPKPKAKAARSEKRPAAKKRKPAAKKPKAAKKKPKAAKRPKAKKKPKPRR